MLNQVQTRLAVFCAIAAAIGFGVSFFATRPGSTQDVNLITDGRHEQAMEQARELYDALLLANWNRNQVDSRLFRLPDQDFDEDIKKRGPFYLSFMTGVPGFPGRQELAFCTDLYTRTNRARGVGAEGVTWRTEGFYIVALKNGQINQVPVEDVRLYAHEFQGKTLYSPVFPGMAVYRDDLRRIRLHPD